MKILAHDVTWDEDFAREAGIERADPDRICREADFISLHTVLNDETRNLINARRLGMMKKTAVLINTARGGLIDETALLAALREGRIYGAGLDVFEQEPPAEPAWYGLDNLVMGSHCSSSTAGATEQMGRMAVDQFAAGSGFALRRVDAVFFCRRLRYGCRAYPQPALLCSVRRFAAGAQARRPARNRLRQERAPCGLEPLGGKQAALPAPGKARDACRTGQERYGPAAAL